MSRHLLRLTLIAIFWLICATANGQIILDITRTDSGGVRVTGSGSGRTTGFAWTSEFRTMDFDNDFLSDSLGTGFINADRVRGRVRNSWGFSRRINNFSVGRSNGSNDDIRFNTRGGMFFWNNQRYTFTIEAIFNRSTLAFDDLIDGAFSDAARNDPTEIFGRTQVEVESVPEPRATMLVAGASLLGLAFIRRRKSRQRSPYESK